MPLTREELEMLGEVISETLERRLAPLRERLDALEADSRRSEQSLQRCLVQLATEDAQ